MEAHLDNSSVRKVKKMANASINDFLDNVDDLTKAIKDVDSPEIARVRAKVKMALAAAKRREDEAEARAAQAEQQRHDAIAKAERDRLAAESEATRREAESAERERQKIAAEQREAEEEPARREADTKHKAPINRAIVAALVSLGLTETMAKAVVPALARGAIPHTKIGY